MPPTKGVFQRLNQGWMPGIPTLCTRAHAQGKLVTRLGGVDELEPSLSVGITYRFG